MVDNTYWAKTQRLRSINKATNELLDAIGRSMGLSRLCAAPPGEHFIVIEFDEDYRSRMRELVWPELVVLGIGLRDWNEKRDACVRKISMVGCW